MDIFTKAKRSDVMSRIRSKGNKTTELRLMELMRERGIRGWKRGSKITGHPDFVFPRARLAVFVDGCFWHGCPKHCRLPSTRKKFWHVKIAKNMKRDRDVTRLLKTDGWNVMRIWSHALTRTLAPRTMSRLLGNLGDNAVFAPPSVVPVPVIHNPDSYAYPMPETHDLVAAEE